MDKLILSRLEKLASIKLSIDDIAMLERSIDDALKCINVLLNVNTDGVEEFSGFYPYKCKLYSDTICDLPSRNDVLSNALQDNGFILVPKFIK
ncbi:Asp-tRNA(Asn)/Glu-tRNA(Gln) amidotransferase subunit GatC [Candidatus Gromoviella agglomerans]|uniref:Asp-tRNA(Asn)/Glu-tRNA(Gln) amidotransferase subunit GatC n=1 Tax=Candidatus Gromoviella agglomerans TaxID=2806609 RepID=UPI001E620E5B|nr:Asp-tRNA(Asn)/Glu-tRNA(Gln) amidotransferase subunit GatC [Candidatus Gromoviella agglomerans]UFX98274.1 Aspartyl/glutamyl-tRNA amidotransferase subunit C [Candidatus Gromoviella agglomerans]